MVASIAAEMGLDTPEKPEESEETE
jgi:hypothetical protein